MSDANDTRKHRELASRLRALRVDAPDGGFGAALHRKLVQAGPPAEPTWWRRMLGQLGQLVPPAGALHPGRALLGPALGAAVAAAAFVVLGPQRQPLPASPSAGALVVAQVPATKVAVVRVNLSADVAVQDARIRISLPDGLYFWADGQELAQREFEWTQPLEAGDNDIPIAVRGRQPGSYRMTVTARINGASVVDDVLLEVVGG